MGQTPAKYFPMPTPYGQSPDMGVLQQAKAAAPAPLNNFLPLNPADPSQGQQPGQQQPPAQVPQMGFQGQLGNDAMLRRQYGGSGGFGMRNLL